MGGESLDDTGLVEIAAAAVDAVEANCSVFEADTSRRRSASVAKDTAVLARCLWAAGRRCWGVAGPARDSALTQASYQQNSTSKCRTDFDGGDRISPLAFH